MNYKIKNIELNVDVDETKAMYKAFLPLNKDDSGIVNYIKNIEQRYEYLQDFTDLGIDMKKPQVVLVDLVIPETQSVCYFCIYPICCDNEQKYIKEVEMEDSNLSNEWKKTSTNFLLSYCSYNGHLCLAVSVEFPWLFKPAIPSSKKLPIVHRICPFQVVLDELYLM